MPPLIEVRNLTKTYTLGEVPVNALQGITLTIARGSFVAVMGASGSGKSTLMNVLGCLDRPTSGCYLLDGIPVESLDRDQLAEIRNQKIGFIFQKLQSASAHGCTRKRGVASAVQDGRYTGCQ